MTFNLLTATAFPVVTRKGDKRSVPFAELANDGPNAPVEFDYPRADLNIAALEFAIGVGTLALRPTRETDWLRLWRAPPNPDTMREKLTPFLHAFQLNGDRDGPQFQQELGGLNGETTRIEALLIDSPGVSGQKKNTDLLTHRDRYPALGLPAAALALYALQQFAPSGGAGNRTSMRGGGPLTTLVIPGAPNSERPSLWRIILANVVARPENDFDHDALPKILPWLAPTLVSDKEHGERVVNEHDPDAHPLQAFFGMPRRIALRFGGDGICPITGYQGSLVEGFVQKPLGVNYGLWQHPLTPYRRQKEASPPYSAKPKSVRFGYRDWVSVTVGTTEKLLAQPAAVVRAARQGGRREQVRCAANGADASLRAAGWATSNMEAISYLSAEQPLHLAASDEAQAALDRSAVAFARAADEAASMLVSAVRTALFSEGASPATDRAVFEETRVSFYESTETAFHNALDAMLADGAAQTEVQARDWLTTISRAAATTFDTCVPVPINDPEHSQRIAVAFGRLRSGLAGYGPQGRRLFEVLGLAPPKPKTTKKGKTT
jgi:CRISPR system Cascade subunit CasA